MIAVAFRWRPPHDLSAKTTTCSHSLKLSWKCTSFHFTPETILNKLNIISFDITYIILYLISQYLLPRFFHTNIPPNYHPPSSITSKVLARFSPRDRERDAFLVDSFSKVSRLCVSGMARCNSCRVSVKLWAVRRDCSKVLADFFLEKQRTTRKNWRLWLVLVGEILCIYCNTVCSTYSCGVLRGCLLRFALGETGDDSKWSETKKKVSNRAKHAWKLFVAFFLQQPSTKHKP